MALARDCHDAAGAVHARRDLGPGRAEPVRRRPRLAQAVLRARLHLRRQFRRVRGVAQPHLRRPARRVPAARARCRRHSRALRDRSASTCSAPPPAASGRTASTRSTRTASVKERWTQWDSLCEGSSGPGPHRLRISPYDPEHRVWVVNETFNTIYVFSNDGSKLLKTLGEKNVPGTDGTHFGKPQDVAFLPDGRILIADGLDNHRVMILDREMNYIAEFGGQGKGPGQFSGVHAIARRPRGADFRARSFGRPHQRLQDDCRSRQGRLRRGVPRLLAAARHHRQRRQPLGDGPQPAAVHQARLPGKHLYTWMVPKDLPDGYLEVHTFTVDSSGNLYGGDNQYGRTQKFVPKPARTRRCSSARRGLRARAVKRAICFRRRRARSSCRSR